MRLQGGTEKDLQGEGEGHVEADAGFVAYIAERLVRPNLGKNS